MIGCANPRFVWARQLEAAAFVAELFVAIATILGAVVEYVDVGVAVERRKQFLAASFV